MKLFITIFAIFAGTHAYLTPEDKAHLAGVVKECVAEAKSDGSFLEPLMTGHIEGLDKPAKCVLQCILTKGGFMSADGNLDMAKVSEKMAPAGADKVEKFKACFKQDPDHCETAFQAIKCKIEAGLIEVL